jgi:Haspin like kinase domain
MWLLASVDKQYEVYRHMRDALQSQFPDDPSSTSLSIWEHYYPETNKLWISFLLERLTHCKSYRKNKQNTAALSALKKLHKDLSSSSSLYEWFMANLVLFEKYM